MGVLFIIGALLCIVWLVVGFGYIIDDTKTDFASLVR